MAELEPLRSTQAHSRPVACATCGHPTDPLRAARVAYVAERFRYFCTTDCRARYQHQPGLTPLPLPRRRRQPTPLPQLAVPTPSPPLDLAAPARPLGAVAELAPSVVAANVGSGVVPAGDVTALLLSLALLGGALSLALGLVGAGDALALARLVIVVVSAGALIAEYVMGRREAIELHPAALLFGPTAGTIVAVLAQLRGHPGASDALSFAASLLMITAGAVWLLARLRRPLELEREHIGAELDVPARRVLGEDTEATSAVELRSGEEIVIDAGETVPADCTITAGSASVVPWLDAPLLGQRGEGEALVAGARITEGRLRAVVSWSGRDRAWLRLTHDPARRADVHTQLARTGHLIATQAAPIAAIVAGLAAYATGSDWLVITLAALGAHVALAQAGLTQLGALHVGRAVLAALRRGIVFRGAAALDRASRVTAGVFMARGTLLLGEPEVLAITPFGAHSQEELLALVAGAEGGTASPTAAAVLRAARARGVRPDAVRSPTQHAGLGVTAVSSNGEALVVGSRALMLRERISVASAEATLSALEALGRSVLLVALDGRLLGVLGLQDGLRPGARAAIQHLLDVGVEPVLLSGDGRETCEAIGNALDIEHIRPEVLPTERAEEVSRLIDGGAVVAVIGRTPEDDAVLTAADVPIALSSAGLGIAEWSVQLASDDVRDAALALRLAKRCRSEVRLALGLHVVPAALGVIATAFGLGPALLAPLLAAGGSAAALIRWRAIEDAAT